MDHISCHTYNILYYYNCSQFKYFIQINLLATTVPLLHVLSPRVVLQTHLAPGDVLVTHMLQRFPPSSFTLFVALASTYNRQISDSCFFLSDPPCSFFTFSAGLAVIPRLLHQFAQTWASSSVVGKG